MARPKISNLQIIEYVQKLEPYLKQGLSVRKSCYLAEIPHSTVYELINNNETFSDKIELFKLYKSRLVSNLFMARLKELTERNENVNLLKKVLKNKRLSPEKQKSIQVAIDLNMLKQSDWVFIQWIALNDKVLREEYGNRTEITQNNNLTTTQILDELEATAPAKTDYIKLAKEASYAIKL